MSSKKKAQKDIPVSVRIPVFVQEVLLEKAKAQDLNFSQLVRRALRRELSDAGILVEETK